MILTVALMLFGSFITLGFMGCKGKKEEVSCQTCTKIICGFAGCDVFEERIICDESEIKQLEESSSGTTLWECE